MINGTHSEVRHASMRDASLRRHLEPIHAAMSEADSIRIRRLRNDHVVRLVLPNPALPCEISNACETAALLIHTSALLDRSLQPHACTSNRLNREDRGCNSGLLVRYSAAIKFAI